MQRVKLFSYAFYFLLCFFDLFVLRIVQLPSHCFTCGFILYLETATLRTHIVYSTLKRRAKCCFHVVSTWNTRRMLIQLDLCLWSANLIQLILIKRFCSLSASYLLTTAMTVSFMSRKFFLILNLYDTNLKISIVQPESFQSRGDIVKLQHFDKHFVKRAGKKRRHRENFGSFFSQILSYILNGRFNSKMETIMVCRNRALFSIFK